MIRSAMPSERLSIGRVYSETWKAAYRGIVPDSFLDSLTEESCAPHVIPEKGLLICERSGEIIGVVSFGPARHTQNSKAGEVYSLYVFCQYWRAGAGRELFEAARRMLRTEGYDSLHIWTLTENRRARQFYERMGMTGYAARTICIGGHDLSETGYIQTLN